MTNAALERWRDPGPESRPRPVRPMDEVDVDVGPLHFDLSCRQPIYDSGHVATLTEVFSRLPAILVHGPTKGVIDGVHRVMAARALGHQTIRARLFTGSTDEATILAVQCNVAHGKPLERRERQDAASRVLHSHPEWSDRRIASVCGLSPKTVGRIRLRASEDTPRLRTAQRAGLDGRVRPVSSGDVRRRIVDALQEHPAASTREIAARAGAAQATVRDVRSSPVGERSAASDALPTGDDAYLANEESRRFAEWFDTHVVREDAEWEALVSAVPIGRVYEIADAARTCADSWRRLATAMESRATRRRPSSG